MEWRYEEYKIPVSVLVDKDGTLPAMIDDLASLHNGEDLPAVRPHVEFSQQRQSPTTHVVNEYLKPSLASLKSLIDRPKRYVELETPLHAGPSIRNGAQYSDV